MLPALRHLTREEWPVLREIRLAALSESPSAFLSTYEKEVGYGPERWASEFDRGEWIIGELHGQRVSLVGVVQAPGTHQDERYLEYVWVTPDRRRDRIAFDMLTNVLDRLAETGIRTVFLWVLNGNDVASWLYKRLDFTTTDDRQQLEADPSRYEERLRRQLA
jgi:ribosomal protein S18 acetylase RimI-like enzyme